MSLDSHQTTSLNFGPYMVNKKHSWSLIEINRLQESVCWIVLFCVSACFHLHSCFLCCGSDQSNCCTISFLWTRWEDLRNLHWMISRGMSLILFSYGFIVTLGLLSYHGIWVSELLMAHWSMIPCLLIRANCLELGTNNQVYLWSAF